MDSAVAPGSALVACRQAPLRARANPVDLAAPIEKSDAERALELSRQYVRDSDCRALKSLCTLVERRIADLRGSGDEQLARKRRDLSDGLAAKLRDRPAIAHLEAGELGTLKSRYGALHAELAQVRATSDPAWLDALVADAQRLGRDVDAVCRR